MMAILFPQINPIALQIGPLSIKWYGIAYALGIILSLFFIQKLSSNRFNRFKEIPALLSKEIDSLGLYMMIGIVLGGRLGYVIFYRSEWFLTRPLMVLNTLEGGMSFHGGLIGMATTLFVFCRRKNISFLSVSDLLCCVGPIGLFFGRLANFINGELYGRITSVPWGIVFPYGGTLPRHPSQLYEAATEGLLLLMILMILFFKTTISRRLGALTGVFMIGYGIARIAIEEYREPDLLMSHFMIRIWDIKITTGQALTMPMLICGMVLILRSKKCVESSV
jgi:phosphatidylglycerol:prolipoprotein diacylglycerol transferase